MNIKTIPLSRLEADPKGTLSECADSGATCVIQLPDDRLLVIQSIDPGCEDDSLTSELLQSNPVFRDLVARSKASPRKPFSTSN
jgi:hypothetical protein